MQARAVDLIRTAPQPAARSAAADNARPVDANEPKPRSKFDDELNRRMLTNDEPPKAETPKTEPGVKAKSRKHDDAKPADDAVPADADPTTDAADADNAVESDEHPAKAEQTKTKSTKKTDAKKSDDADAEAGEDAVVTADASQVVTLPTADLAADVGDDLAIDADAAKGDVDHADGGADAGTDVTVDLTAAQQLAAQQQTVASGTTADATASTTDDDAAAGTIASATTATSAKPAASQAKADEAVQGDGELEAVPRQSHAEKSAKTDAADIDAQTDDEAAGAFQLPPDAEKASAATAGKKEDLAALPAAIQPTATHEKSAAAALPPTATPQQPTPMRDPAEHNVDKIVTSVRGELLTKGGTMDIRLDPPTLGPVQVQITVDDGVLSANLQTTNDEATRLLSHNLAQLKTQLESAGVTVDRIQVKQAAPAEQSNQSTQGNADGDSRQKSAASQDQSARQEQQRREAMQRMWARVAGNGDPLDLVA